MLGIDVSKASLTCSLIDPQTFKPRWTRDFANTSAGLAALLRQTPPEVPWVVEPTGRYSCLVVSLGTTAGRAVLLAEPQRAKQFLASLPHRSKTDRLDSRGLALYGLSRPLRPFPQKSPTIERLDQLRAGRRGLVGAIARLQLQAKALPHAAAGLEVAIKQLEHQQAEFDQQIAVLLADQAQFPMAEKLQAVPGIGATVAAGVLSCLAAKQFSHSDQFVAYVGLAVRDQQSGKNPGRSRLSKHGDAELRRLLYLGARANLRCRTSPFKDQYERERAKGLTPTEALCAVARKLARVCWSMWKYQTDYDPARVFQQPKEHGGRTANQATSPATAAPPPK